MPGSYQNAAHQIKKEETSCASVARAARLWTLRKDVLCRQFGVAARKASPGRYLVLARIAETGEWPGDVQLEVNASEVSLISPVGETSPSSAGPTPPIGAIV